MKHELQEPRTAEEIDWKVPFAEDLKDWLLAPAVLYCMRMDNQGFSANLENLLRAVLAEGQILTFQGPGFVQFRLSPPNPDFHTIHDFFLVWSGGFLSLL